MYHTLKTLYEFMRKNRGDILAEFYQKYPDSKLKEYCYDADELYHKVDLNRGYNSLKWFIYFFRDKVKHEELEYLFQSIIVNSIIFGEDKIYNDVKKLVLNKDYIKTIDSVKIDVANLPIIEHNGLKIIINNTKNNLTSYIFKRKLADVIVFYDKENKWAGVVASTDLVENEKINMAGIFVSLMQRDEEWAIIGKNLIICGGHKFPHKTTDIELNELVDIVKENIAV